jgi:hypothetical protein
LRRYETSEHKTAMHWAAEVGRLDSIGGLLKVGRCRLTLSIPVLKVPVVPSLEPIALIS